METGFTTTLLSTAIGSIITWITVYLKDVLQTKRDKFRFQHDFAVEKLKIESETSERHRSELLQNMKEVNNTIGKIEGSISLTASVIESSCKLNYNDFDQKHLDERLDLINVRSIAVIYFRDLINNIENVINLHNNYWGHQRMLLREDVNTNQQSYMALQKKIIEISNEALSEVVKIRHRTTEIAADVNGK